MKIALLSLALIPAGLCAGIVNETGIRLPYGQPAQNSLETGKHPTILYHGGPVLYMVNRIYIVYYGTFPDGPTGDIAVIDNFFEHIGGTGQYNVNSTYYDGQGHHIVNALSFNPNVDTYRDNYSLGTTLKNGDAVKLLHTAIGNGIFPADTEAIYFIFTSPDVHGQLFERACGWHAHTARDIVAGKDIKYSLVGEFRACSGNIAVFHDPTSPNGNPALDGALDTAMHELSETVTDPDINAWFTDKGAEVGDLCNFKYGTTYLAPNGTHANLHLGDFDYLVQTIWENSGAGFCANSLP